MEEKNRYLEARRRCGFMGWSLLVYYILLNVAVSLAYVADLAVYFMIQAFRSGGQELDFENLMLDLTDRMMTNFWGYILAIAIGLLILLLWKKKAFWTEEIWAKGKAMSAPSFLLLLVFVIGSQVVSQILTPVMEYIFNLFGLSIETALANATITGESLSMFLYISFLGPFAEEILFRGLILRTLRPYGKQAAIVISSILFALYHGNIVQIPYTFVVGLLLGYVAVEYSIFWSIILHIFNNFVLADLLGRFAELLPEGGGDIFFLVLVICAAIGCVVACILRRKEVVSYFKENPLDKTAMKGFVASPGVWVFTVLMLLSTALLFVV